MNICFICDEYPPVSHGGIGTVTKSIAEELARQNHKVFVIGLLPVSFGGNTYEEINGVRIWRIHHGVKIPLLSRKNLLYKGINKILKTDFVGIEEAWTRHNKQIENIVKDFNIDVIEFPDFRFGFSYLNRKTNIWPEISIPKVVKFHGSINYFNFEANTNKSQKEYFYENELYKYASQLVSVSQYTKDKMKSYYNINKSIEVIHNGLELVNKEDTKEKEHFVIFSGSLVPKKGIIPLLKAWNNVCEKDNKVILKIYGKGVKERYLKYINSKNKHQVKFLGHTSKENLLTEYNNSKIAIFPSFAEAFALAPMESMMIGCPTIYSNTTSGSELLVEESALVLINPHNINEISSNILKLLNDDALRKSIGSKGKKLIKEKFNIEVVVSKHLKLFYSLNKE